MAKKLISLLLVSIAFATPVFLILSFTNKNTAQPSNNNTNIQLSAVKAATTQPKPSFNNLLYPTNDYKSLWAIISVNTPIPSNYRPDDLELIATAKGENIFIRSVVKERAESMLRAAAKEMLNIKITSGFRSFSQQRRIYAIKAEGIAAKPGYSEHQLGLAIDVSAGTNENIWLANHAHKYGFIIRYPENKQSITGFAYEPWHLRYVGVELATEIKTSNKTMEEYFGQR